MELDCREMPAVVYCPLCYKCLYALNPDVDHFYMGLCEHVAYIEDAGMDKLIGTISKKVKIITVWTGGWTETSIAFSKNAIPRYWRPKAIEFLEQQGEYIEPHFYDEEDSFQEPSCWDWD